MFLYFVVPMLIFNYLGTMYHSEAGLAKVFRIPVFILLVLWLVILLSWAGYKLFPKTCSIACWNSLVQRCCSSGCCEDCERFSKKIRENKALIMVSFTGLFFFPIIFASLWIAKVFEFTDAFLYLCLTENAFAAFGPFILSCCFCSQSDCSGCNKWCKILFRSLQIPFLVAACVILQTNETIDKSKSPEKSRDLNRECNFMGFFDWHDIWHIFYSFGFLISALAMIHDSYEPPKEIQDGDRPNYGSTQTCV